MSDKTIVDLRMKQFDKDVLHWRNYDYVVINDELEDSFKEICVLIKSESDKTKNNYNLKFIEDHVKKLIS